MINIGTSKDTSEFACDSLKKWFEKCRSNYPNATSILALCDGGGSNNSRHHVFKENLQKLSHEIGIEIRIAHYPPYTSKYNLIEHRLFPHITRACKGVTFKTVELVKKLMEKTKTSTGLSVVVNVIDTVYETGKKASDDFLKNPPVSFDDFLGKWNYKVAPSVGFI
jgi:hypothetical protein